MNTYIEELKKLESHLSEIIKGGHLEIIVSSYLSQAISSLKDYVILSSSIGFVDKPELFEVGSLKECKIYVDFYLSYEDLNVYTTDKIIIQTLSDINIDLLEYDKL